VSFHEGIIHVAFTCMNWFFVYVYSGPPNNPRYGSDAPRLRQPVDGSTDSDRDTAAGRQPQRNGDCTWLRISNRASDDCG